MHASGRRPMPDEYTPTPDDHFTFGLWTVGNRGRDPFGHETRPPLDPVDTVTKLAELGAYGVNFHDDDLVPPGSSPAEREHIVERGYELDIAIEPKPNEPRGNLFLPTVGHALAFIHELAHPEMVGLNPEFAHETMSGLSFHHGVAQALWADKLFHIDLNGQSPGKYDQDFRFGSEGVRDAFYLVKLLEDAEWEGMRHFDAHAYRTESVDGVWEFARGCMRTYLILKAKAARFRTDPDIADALLEAQAEGLAERILPDGYSSEAVARLRSEQIDVDALAARGCGHERLDQLVTELLLGVR